MVDGCVIYHYAGADASSVLLLDVVAATPSNMNGPAVFVGVKGPSLTSMSMVGVCDVLLRVSVSIDNGAAGVCGLEMYECTEERRRSIFSSFAPFRLSAIVDGARLEV